MLKNKFGMLKVLALALSVLMLVSLAACGNSGVAEEDMNAAIQAALSEQAAADASKQAALESSLAAAQAAAESERKAAESSLAAAAAEAEKKAEEASKAAASAEKKASEEASKAAASAAEASKAAASISASISKSQADAAKTSQSTTAPIVADKDAIAAVQAEFAKLRHEYTYTNEGLYLADNYAELTLLFDKAAVELQNALTKEAAESILATLKVEAAAIENAQSRADAVQALVAELGDIESEVFTTQAEKITAANKALSALKKDYNKKSGMDQALLAEVIEDTINTADLTKANAKLVVLEDYIKAALWNDMALLNVSDPKVKYDAEDDIDSKLVDANDKATDVTYRKVIDRAYYKYLVLATINGGDMVAADLEIDWEYKYDEETGKVVTDEAGNKVYDDEKPIEWFTAESLLEDYILPTLDVEFAEYKAAYLAELKTALTSAYTTLSENVITLVTLNKDTAEEKSYSALAPKTDVDDLFEDAADAFEVELDGLSFTGDYKGNATLADAIDDLTARLMAAYIDALSNSIEISKEYAIEIYTDKIYDVNVLAHEKKFTADSQATLLASKLETEAKYLEAFTANVNATPAYDYDALNDLELRDKYGKVVESVKVPVAELTEMSVKVTKNETTGKVTAIDVDSAFYTYADKVIVDAINNNFKVRSTSTQAGMLGVLVSLMNQDLEAFKEKWTVEDGTGYDLIKGDEVSNPWDDEETYKNADKIVALAAIIDKANEDLAAVDVADYTDTEVQIKWLNANGSSWKKKALWFKSADAKAHYETKGYTEADMVADFNLMKQYFTTSGSDDLKYTYTHTAEEQACLAAEAIYLKAYADMHAQIVSIQGYVKAQTESIDNGKDNNTGYEKAYNAVKGNETLLAEVVAYGDVYKNNIANASYQRALGLGGNEDKTFDFVNKSDTIVADAHITYLRSYQYNAEKDKYEFVLVNEPAKEEMRSTLYDIYNLVDPDEDVDGYMETQVKICNDNAGKLADLWADKNAAVAKVAAAVNAAKYTYATNDKGQLEANGDVTYAYDATSTSGKTTVAINYEAALDKILADATKEIMAVTMNNKELDTIKTWAGGKTVWNTDDTKIAYSYDTAKKLVDAYVEKYLGIVGEDGTYNTVTLDGVTHPYADSKIFEAYKIYVKSNYQTWGQLTTGTVTPAAAQ